MYAANGFGKLQNLFGKLLPIVVKLLSNVYHLFVNLYVKVSGNVAMRFVTALEIAVHAFVHFYVIGYVSPWVSVLVRFVNVWDTVVRKHVIVLHGPAIIH